MNIYPAIDLRGGRVVRLRQGDYGDMTVYDLDPVAVALDFKARGSRYLHIVDLDAAKDEGQKNLGIIQKIASVADMFIEVGGGARDEDSVRRYIDAGVKRVILGSVAVENPRLAMALADRHPGTVACGVDAKNGFVATHGWRIITNVSAPDFIKGLPGLGIDTVIYTDISMDGMMKGPNFEAYSEISKIPGLDVIASGGVSAVSDVRKLSSMGLYGAIIGKALYDGGITLEAAIEAGEARR